MDTVTINGTTYNKVSPHGQDLQGKLVLIKENHVHETCVTPEMRIARCMYGFGCKPYVLGNVYVEFLYDGEESQWERPEIECILEPKAGVAE